MARHPSITNLLRWFEHDHLPPFRKLLEAKDCFVRASIFDQEKKG